ncbi:MAG: hypothetical protein MSA49_06815, partial [Clostridia bacterium]|nr:hypothetical protein [Clostridia bacterium]
MDSILVGFAFHILFFRFSFAAKRRPFAAETNVIEGVKNSMFLTPTQQGRAGSRPFGFDLGRFCLPYLVFSVFFCGKTAALRRRDQ